MQIYMDLFVSRDDSNSDSSEHRASSKGISIDWAEGWYIIVFCLYDYFCYNIKIFRRQKKIFFFFFFN
jgi:hypothetical protein